MDRQPWLDRLNEELAGRGLPAGVRSRFLAELQDHLDDLTEGGKDMMTGNHLGLRMGKPEVLAEQAAADYHRTSWVRRHPRIVFLLAPVPAALMAVALYLLAASAVAYGASEAGFAEPGRRGTLEGVVTGYVASIRFVPFMLAAAYFTRLALRAQSRLWCPIAAVTQIAILAGFATTNLTWSDVPGQSQFALGLTFPFSGWGQAIQLVVPLAAAGMMLGIASRRRAGIAM
ncbi:MAG: hypothetical protein U0791_12125 [Gemmataceae bacterium]